ncbi:phosphoribosylanthranilate isomerase [Rhodopseudomonas sp. HC1]|uniref:phosphoribosylanthranilate isomerase n=1 Tax=Rhodopseudomonas infernalis TaxID=2897386 RepID=UPI001EE8E744|nr:phosphoribosylanthranilate isomerase [Rhodopseudomonas infernalis]MCG6207887.1 phosphoribosylanthranilate isomerase [Rhodopseudomonas infernalis]
MSVVVKICGLSTCDTLEAAVAAGADMVGFVFFPASPRHVGMDVAADLGKQVAGRAAKVALTVDASDALIRDIVEILRPDLLQLHGHESPQRVQALKQTFGLPVMKAIAVATAADLAVLPAYAAAADRLLFDARPPRDATRPGGLGTPFDWELLRDLDLALPFMVSGGIHAGNVAEALRITRAGGVDVSSGVEQTPGTKDPDMIRSFIRAARASEELMT